MLELIERGFSGKGKGYTSRDELGVGCCNAHVSWKIAPGAALIAEMAFHYLYIRPFYITV